MTPFTAVVVIFTGMSQSSEAFGSGLDDRTAVESHNCQKPCAIVRDEIAAKLVA